MESAPQFSLVQPFSQLDLHNTLNLRTPKQASAHDFVLITSTESQLNPSDDPLLTTVQPPNPKQLGSILTWSPKAHWQQPS